jgi:hypothetical protein
MAILAIAGLEIGVNGYRLILTEDEEALSLRSTLMVASPIAIKPI